MVVSAVVASLIVGFLTGLLTFKTKQQRVYIGMAWWNPDRWRDPLTGITLTTDLHTPARLLAGLNAMGGGRDA